MHICYVLGTFPTTSETFVSDEIATCIKAGHKVTIVRIYQGNTANHANVEWVQNNVDIIDIKEPQNTITTLKTLAGACIESTSLRPLLTALTHHPRWAMTAMLPTFRQLQRKKFDHIHAHFADKQVLFAHALSRLMRVPFSFTMHGYDIRDLPIGKHNLSNALDAAKCAFTVSKANIAALKKTGVKTDKFSTIPCGIDPSNFSVCANPYTGGRINITCIARLHPIKNHKTLLQALAMISDDVDFQLKLIGDGELRDELTSLVSENTSLNQKVIFLGSLNNEQVMAELRNAHMHILPSLNEGMPVANTEAMATGLVCIASNVGGLPEAIRHKQNGFLFNPKDPAQLRDIISDIYFKRVNTENIAETARSDALNNFDRDRLVMHKLSIMRETTH
ncbi:glycosyltransferase family 4 protein [Aquabacterium sp. G14]|uniref:glycosyltransferase family 4 protein n=1 Tax=Aquabacterium sp. G14 TaxID=3130164 RepID=UPI0030AC74DB